MAEQIELDLDPKKVTVGITEIGEKSKELSRLMQQELGEKAAKSVKTLEDAAAKGSSNIASYFKDLGKRVKEDLKHAFDLSGVLSGLKFADELKKGLSSVFEMSRAFDRLNTRLGLSRQQVAALRTDLGRRAAATGAGLEAIMPGVENVAAKGNVKSPAELAKIGEMLGQVKQTTGEDVGSLSESIVETIKNQGKVVNASNFKSVLDAVQATRTNGAFRTAGEASAAIEAVSPYSKQMGLSTRETGGMVAQASQSGSSGVGILQQLMQRGSEIGGQGKLNAMFGSQVFKNGKLSAEGLGGINTKQFGKYSPQILEQATGISGASGADLMRFVESFKHGQDALKKVNAGSNETKAQFDEASDNILSGLERFREKTKHGVREVLDSLGEFGHAKMGDTVGPAKRVLSAVTENGGTLAAATATTAVVAMLAGGSLKSLLKGAGGKAAGLAEGEAYKQLGIQPVFVVNADQMGGKLGDTVIDQVTKFGGGSMGKIGSAVAGAGALGTAALTAVGIGAVGYAALHSEKGHTDDEELAERNRLMAEAVATGAQKGIERATIKSESKGPLTNPSDVRGRGGIR